MKENHYRLTSKSSKSGQAMIEFALILPVIVLLTVAVMDLARAIYAYGVISNAARVGAHYAALDSKNSPEIEKRIFGSIAGLDKTKILKPIGVECAPNPDNHYMDSLANPEEHYCDSWNYISVEVRYKYEPALLMFNPIIMSSRSTMTIE